MGWAVKGSGAPVVATKEGEVSGRSRMFYGGGACVLFVLASVLKRYGGANEDKVRRKTAKAFLCVVGWHIACSPTPCAPVVYS